MATTVRQYRFEEACNILGVSYESLAVESGVSLNTIKRIASGNNPFGVQKDTAAHLARALGLSRRELKFSTNVSRLGRPGGMANPVKILRCPTHGYELRGILPCPKCAGEL